MRGVAATATAVTGVATGLLTDRETDLVRALAAAPLGAIAALFLGFGWASSAQSVP